MENVLTAETAVRPEGLRTSFSKVLLVEDNPGDARLVELLLLESDLVKCKITHRKSLTEAIATLREDPDFEAILLDLSLPDSRGFETLEKLIGEFSDKNIIVLTGFSDKTLGVQAVKAGAQDFLVKGNFDSDELAKTLRFSIERNKFLKRLEETQKKYQEIFSTSKDAIFIASSQGLLVECNQAALELTGLSREQIFEKNIHDTFFPPHARIELAERIQLGRSVQDFEIEIHRPGGEVRHCLITANLLDADSDSSYTGFVRDITERKQAEELRKARDVARQSASLREQFIASVSHEMRTPMNAIYGMSNLMLKTELNQEQLQYIHSVKQSSELLLAIVNDILEISTIQNGKIQFDYRDFSLHEFLSNLVNVMMYKVIEKNLGFELSIDQSIPQYLKGDKLRLNQILYNLLGNAIKFTDEGNIGIWVEIIVDSPDSIMLKFRVEDSGIGIPANKLEAIFETFTRVRSKDRIYEGTGLGLSIAKSLVEQQGGKIWVESEVGDGSKFFFDMIFERGKAPGEIKTSANDDIDFSKKFSLLLVEDHKMNQIVAQKTLEKQWPNIEIIIAENGQLAIEALAGRSFDLILMDLQMPVMDGYEATKHIREKLPPPKSGIPVLAMTAHAHISKDGKFREHGMDDFVLKPFEPDDLHRKIASIISATYPA